MKDLRLASEVGIHVRQKDREHEVKCILATFSYAANEINRKFVDEILFEFH